MKRSKRVTSALVCFLAVLMLLPGQSAAAGKIDLNQTVSLTISYMDKTTPIAGAQFDLYLVATVDEYGELTRNDAVLKDSYPLDLAIRGENDEAWRSFAVALAGYIGRDQTAPTDSGKTNEQGQLSFPAKGNPLKPGLYLVLGHRQAQNGYYYDAAPFLVMLPELNRDANDWNYAVTVKPKHDSEPIPSRPSSITRKVLKKWEDNGYEEQRPKEVIVQLLRDGKVYDTVTLCAENNWRHTWSGLSSRYSWTIVEKELENYTVAVFREGITFVVTNTYKEKEPEDPGPIDPPPTDPTNPTDPTDPSNPTDPAEPSNPTDPGKPTPPEPSDPAKPTQPAKPSKPSLPQTGQLWWPVPVLACSGMLLIIVGLLRRRGNPDENE